MNSIKLSMTAQAPSRLGMPISGRAFGMSADACTATTLLVRDRVAVGGTAAVTGAVEGDFRTDKAIAPSYFPGTSAWRPPIC